MIKAIVVDDETKIREVLIMKLATNHPEIEIVAQAKDISEAKEQIFLHSPQIVFLDIEMPGGSGLDLLEQIDLIDFEVIFVTGFNKYAIDALKLSAVDYLLKPIKTKELIKAVEKAKTKLETNVIVENYNILKHNINNVGDQNTKVGIPNNDAYDFVQISEIIRCEGWNKYTKVILSSGKEILSSYNIGVFKDMLEQYGFYACHRSHLINKAHIQRYAKEGSIKMSDGSQIPVARRRKETFVQEVLADKIIR